MSSADRTERRRADRVDAQISLQVHLPLGDGPTDVETINVSSAGMYFRSPHYVEPMTKLELAFDVPIGDEDLGAVVCEGIVVRVQPELPDEQTDEYKIGVFFTTIDPQSQGHLEDYVEARLRAAGGA